MGNDFRILFDGIDHLSFELCIPEVVIDEVVNKHREYIEKRVNKIRDEELALCRLLSKTISPVLSSEQIVEESERYRKFILAELRTHNAVILAYPSISHKIIAERDLARRKPFRQNGKGYRDCLTWETVLSIAQESPSDHIAFIVKDKKDFFEHGRLHKDLQSDLEKHAIDPEKFYCYNTLDKFNQVHIISQLESIEETKIKFQQGEIKEFDLRQWIKEDLLSSLAEDNLAMAGLGIPKEEGFQINIGNDINHKEPYIETVQLMHSGDLLLTVEENIQVNISVASNWEDYRTDKEVKEFWLENKHRVTSLYLEDTCDIKISFSLILQKNTYEVLSTTIKAISGERSTIIPAIWLKSLLQETE